MEQRVIHFGLMAEQPERAVRFYADVFGWKAQRWDGPQEYRLLSTGDETGPAINGGVAPLHCPDGGAAPPAATVNTIGVPSVDAAAERVARHGGKVVLPKMEIPGVDFLAYCQDTEGITFGIIEAAPGAPSC